MFILAKTNSPEDTFKQVFYTYKNRLFAYVFSISHSTYIAEEITQEIFVKLWLCRDVLDRIENLEAYVFTIARNKTLNHFRKAAYDNRLMNELQQSMLTSCNNVEEKAQVSDYEKLLQEALSLLSPQRRLVYQLSRNQGLNHEEIAQHLHLSRNTVKNHLVTALQFIREHVGKHSAALVFLLLYIGF